MRENIAVNIKKWFSLLSTISLWNNLPSRYLRKPTMVHNPSCISIQINDTSRPRNEISGGVYIFGDGNIKRERKRGCASFMAQRESRLFVCLPLLVFVIKVFASLFHWAIVEVGKKLGEVSLQFDSSKTETGISDALSFSEISLACQCL